ncbi:MULTISPECIES: hypothetical protein [unclassified Candidatus Cardinium]|uniref:hypothetical protein n=1 Tax=unclassified Candidatus Cardinium TaxID=2641185 RepID=UPI001FB2C14D|nr:MULTISPECIES: hypothetical protein [unclassified Candidatus Cardinium]
MKKQKTIMANKLNNITSIRKGFISPSFIFSATYILFSGKACPSFYNSNSSASSATTDQINHSVVSAANNLGNKVNDPNGLPPKDDALETNAFKKLDKAELYALGVTSLSGQATLLDLHLGDASCGVFVVPETEERLLVKLPSQDGWTALSEQDEVSGKLYMRYDTVSDSRMIKMDPALFALLSSQLSQSTHSTLHSNVAFCYKPPLGDKPIFAEDGITSSTMFKKDLYKKFNISSTGDLTLASSRLSITGSVSPDKLQGLKQVGFLLVRDDNSLANLVKAMLATDPTWLAKAAVAETKEYIICPASLVGNELKADAFDLDIKSQDKDKSLRLEGYASVYCYLNYGSYYRLIKLDNLKLSITKDTQQFYQPFYSYTAMPTPAIVPSQPPVSKEANGSTKEVNKSKDETDGDPQVVNGEPNPIINEPVVVESNQVNGANKTILPLLNPAPSSGQTLLPFSPPPLTPTSRNFLEAQNSVGASLTNNNNNSVTHTSESSTTGTAQFRQESVSLPSLSMTRSNGSPVPTPPPPPPLPFISNTNTVSPLLQPMQSRPEVGMNNSNLSKEANVGEAGNHIISKDEIKEKLKQLKTLEKLPNVNEQPLVGKTDNNNNHSGLHYDLLKQIQEGIKLKNAQDRPLSPKSSHKPASLPEILAKLLQDRSQQMTGNHDNSEDEGQSSSDSDGEWD